MLTIDELISRLEDLREELGDGVEVRIAMQEHWPLQSHIRGVAQAPVRWCVDEGECADDDPTFRAAACTGRTDCRCGDCPGCGAEEDAPVVWIVEDAQVREAASFSGPYAPRGVFEEAR
jgi:hypothetical protein